ncbi:hypothetical protein BN1708_005429 [Verticillium longisporum]|uniref:Homeobox domain-containing protein n=1 Tax=Verticillium longisporum TaxID=100787 RepID=A0A0G4MBC5_VERLO|nr:hypothetical protein BN1708_005429 [Verticillium longisporum]
MSVSVHSVPPEARTSYIIDQLEGERLTIPGSKGVFRILASSKQTNGGIAVFFSGAVLSDAPGFHWHEEAHDVFMVTKGSLKLWNGDKCRIMGPGDFAYVPPKVIHNPEMLGPHTELNGLVAPGDWIDFFRFVAESYDGVLVPENDNRNLGALLGQKMATAKDRFDVHFERNYQPPALGDWLETENVLPSPGEPYFLRANTGPRWMLGGVMSRPFLHASQCGGKFAVSSIESSKVVVLKGILMASPTPEPATPGRAVRTLILLFVKASRHKILRRLLTRNIGLLHIFNMCIKVRRDGNLSEAFAMQFVASHTSIPVPKVYYAFVHRGTSYIVMRHIKGQMAAQGWSSRPDESKTRILRQLCGMVSELRSVPSPEGTKVSSVDGGPFYDCRLPSRPYWGPYDTVREFHEALADNLPWDADYTKIPDLAELFAFYRQAENKLVLTHGDLSSLNILCTALWLPHTAVGDGNCNETADTDWPSEAMSASSSGVANGPAELEISSVPAKVGTRFSTRALRVLRNWFAAHEDHPYPRAGDMESLQAQTGLNKLQVSTWLANTRRRTKSRVPVRPTSPSVLSTPNLEAMEIPTSRRPELVDQMDPLGRWQNSPPEDEAADAKAILKAISGSPDASAQPSHPILVRPQPSVWGEWSSASSAGTSQSSNSSGGSAYSHGSASSRAQSRDLARYTKHKRRRNRGAAKPATPRTKLSQLPRKFQCTFCTESFAQKHGWQRHEKSLHLSLERWECSPEGPYTRDDDGHQACAYCSRLEPDEGHMKTHNFEVCMDRLPEERSFYRKDHLIQHLKAVHHVKFDPPLMEHWKQTIQDIQSSCGFCGLLMTSWTERADHLADHFKSGATMAQWLDLIEFERTSPWPFTTDRGPPATPANAFELIKIELDYFASCLDEKNVPPSQEVLQYESCCVIVGSEMLSPSQDALNTPRSWLRDLLMSDEHVARRARNTPLASIVKARATELRINSKADIFDSCSLEEQLQLFMAQNHDYESPVDDVDLQRGACQVVQDADAQSRQPLSCLCPS